MSHHIKFLSVLILGVWFAAASSPAAPPNVVFILADDLGGHDLGCYGSKFHQTPNLDALARRGMRFVNAYSASPLCSPTRSSILTGLNPARIGITAPACHLPAVQLEKRLAKGNAKTRILNADTLTRFKTEYVTLPEVLREAGYRTGHFGKWHLGPEPYSPLQHGFDVDLPHTPGPGPGGGNGYFAPWQFWKGEGKPGDHIEDRMAEEAVKFIRANKDRPFFLNYWAFSVHSPWMGKQDYMEEAAKRAEPGAPQRNPLYAAMVRSLDEAVGRLVATLEELKLTENTVIIFTSDNGGWHNLAREASNNKAYADIPVTSNAPLRSGKASNYEGGTRVPLIVVWPPKIQAGSQSDAIVQSIDYFPTLAELTAAKVPPQVRFDGISIVPALEKRPLSREMIFSHFPHGGRGDIDGFQPATWVRSGDWKLIRFFAAEADGKDRLELYNLREDVGEKTNLATTKPELTAALNAAIGKFLTENEAVVPILNPDYQSVGEAENKAGPKNAKALADPLQGWKARQCTATVKDSVATVVPEKGATPFLGFAAGKSSGPAELKARIRTEKPGKGRVEWLPTGQASDLKKSGTTPFDLPGGEWQEIRVNLPTSGPLGIVRLYLPPDAESIQVDWIELKPAKGPLLRTNF